MLTDLELREILLTAEDYGVLDIISKHDQQMVPRWAALSAMRRLMHKLSETEQ